MISELFTFFPQARFAEHPIVSFDLRLPCFSLVFGRLHSEEHLVLFYISTNFVVTVYHQNWPRCYVF